MPDGRVIATTFSGAAATLPEYRANQVLFAAAPDMLAALQSFIAAQDVLRGEALVIHRAADDAARAAIAKATKE